MATKQTSRAKQAQAQAITLKGSTAIVTDFFKFAVNMILYQRGVYPADDFHFVKKYGQVVMLTQDLGLENYIDTVLQQVQKWLMDKSVTQLVLAIISKDTRQTLERWTFDIILEEDEQDPSADPSSPSSTAPSKPPKDLPTIQSEIRSILKHITSTTTFLPSTDPSTPTVFNILAYTAASASVPVNEWVDTDALAIEAGKSQSVKLRGFSTDVHRVEAMVAYRFEG